MRSGDESLLEGITHVLMRSPRNGQIDALRLAIGAIAQCALDYPEWLPSLPVEDRLFIEKVLEVANLFASGTENAAVH